MTSQPKTTQQKSKQVVLCSMVVLAMVGGLAALGWLNRLEWLTTDWLQRIAAQQTKPHPDVHFVVLDQRSLDAAEEEFGLSWPWMRDSYGPVLDFLTQAQARIIFFDFLFTEFSVHGVEDDQSLAEALQRTPNVYLPLITSSRGLGQTAGRLLQARPDIFIQPKIAPGIRLPVNQGLTLPVAPILENAGGFGDARFTPDEDGVARRVPPLIGLANTYLPHLGLAPMNHPPQKVRLEKGRLHWGQQQYPLDAQGNLVLRFPGYWRDYPRTSIIDVITSHLALAEGVKPSVDPLQFKDKIVIIGSTAEGLMDLRKTPLESRAPGFYILAATYVAALTNRFYDERWKPGLLWPLLLLLILCGAVWGAQPFIRGVWLLAVTGLLFMGIILWLFFAQSIMLNIVTPVMGLLTAYGFSLGLSYQQEQKIKRFIQSAFSQVLSKTVLDHLLHNPERLQVGGEEAELTIYFSDLAGFTQLSEKLNPRDLVEVLNTYLDSMVRTIVEENEGYVDKFIGDAVMAFWGAPMPVADHALRACRSALQNQSKLKKMQSLLGEKGLTAPLGMRIGIHTGPAVVGMMGSPQKMNYTIIGDAVNLASRLEGVNKQFGTAILASWETVSLLDNKIICREIDRIRVKGKQEPTRIFEVVGLPGQLDKKTLQLISVYQQGTGVFWKREFKAALALFNQAAVIRPDDQPTQIFIRRAEKYAKRPPAKKWDGVTTLKTK